MSDKRGFFVPPEWIRSFYPPLIQEKIMELSHLAPEPEKESSSFFQEKALPPGVRPGRSALLRIRYCKP
ncbi:hypothetical protein CXT84_05665 [Akkermansia muciniphila]|nr:hypothetical protein CXT84_05665 [Akkermansia muciniphila]